MKVKFEMTGDIISPQKFSEFTAMTIRATGNTSLGDYIISRGKGIRFQVEIENLFCVSFNKYTRVPLTIFT